MHIRTFCAFAFMAVCASCAPLSVATDNPRFNDIISFRTAERMDAKPEALLALLAPKSDFKPYKAEAHQVYGPMWTGAVYFWTKPIPAVGASPSPDEILCSSQRLLVLLNGHMEAIDNLYGPASISARLSPEENCERNSDPTEFFFAENSKIAEEGLKAFVKLLSISPEDERDRIEKDCNGEKGRFCGISKLYISYISSISENDCTYSYSTGNPLKEYTEKYRGITADKCFEIQSDGLGPGLLSSQTIVIEADKTTPRAYIDNHGYMI